MTKPNRKVFSLAAQKLFETKQYFDSVVGASYHSPYACYCIEDAIDDLFGASNHTDNSFAKSKEHQFFEEHFMPPREERHNAFGWWKSGTHDNKFAGHDWESRLLALLLCAEMLKSEK